jgi:hypothetical protein
MYQVYHVNDVVENNQKIKFKINKIYKVENGKVRFIVESLSSGFVVDICRASLYTGKFIDKLDMNNSLGICVGYADTKLPRYYGVWRAMWGRCGDKNRASYRWYGGSGVTVCDRWRRLDYFIEDCKNIRGFDEEKFYNNEIQLDKDILGAKIYSKDTCIFVPSDVNRVNTRRNKKFIIKRNNKFLGEYTVIKECANDYGLDNSCIAKCLKGKRKSHKGYVFEYL